jgi:TolA-binding protein
MSLENHWMLFGSLGLAWCGLLGGLSGCGGAKAAPSPERFHEGRAALMQAKFPRAIEQLSEHLEKHPEGDLAGRATFLIGKAHLGLGDWAAAETWFEKTMQKFPNTEEAHKAQYKIAVVKLLQGETAEAKKRFAELAEHPNGSYTPEAVAMTRYLDQAETE